MLAQLHGSAVRGFVEDACTINEWSSLSKANSSLHKLMSENDAAWQHEFVVTFIGPSSRGVVGETTTASFESIEQCCIVVEYLRVLNMHLRVSQATRIVSPRFALTPLTIHIVQPTRAPSNPSSERECLNCLNAAAKPSCYTYYIHLNRFARRAKNRLHKGEGKSTSWHRKTDPMQPEIYR